MDVYFDINKMCRICLKNEPLALVSIFNTAFTVRPADMIRKLDLFKIDLNDDLPTCLCQPCICRLLDAYNLKQQSELAELRFREHLGATIAAPTYIAKKNLISSSTEDHLRDSNLEKDEEIYEAMNAVCDIFDKDNPSDDIEVSDDTLNDVTINVNNFAKSEIEEEKINLKLSGEEKITNNESNMITVAESSKAKNKRKKIVLQDPEKCSQCGKSFSYFGYLETHMRMHTGEKPFQCEICNRSFSQIGNLSLHKRIHTGEKRYQCEICSKLFSTSSNLTAHKRCHSDVRNYKCENCFRLFKSQRELNSHSGTHTGVKSFVCSTCHKAFYKQTYLNLHIRNIHKGEKNHKCDECKKVFSNRSNLICHLRIHTGEKPYKCNICDIRFSQSSALVRHSKQHSEIKQSTLSCTNSNQHMSNEKY